MALTKGRLQEKTLALFEKAGLDCSQVDENSRRLIHGIANYPLDVVLVKAPDVITYVEHGVCELGVVGKDTILEKGSSFYEVLDLGFGRCRFALAAPVGANLFGKTRDLRIATKYPNVAKAFFDGRGLNVETIKIEGSVELAPILGLADAIVDIVETGTTLKENGLELVEDIAQISARIIVNVAAMKMRRAEISELVEKCRVASPLLAS
jgi:ATP phosphoribosyltransferase